MPWSQVIGQETAVRYLRSALAKGRLAHGYLFAGPYGVGKQTAARAFAAAYFCRTAYGEGCGECRDCRRVASGQHPDLVWAEVSPSARLIRVDVLEKLQERVYRSSVEGRGKVVVLPVAERMNETSANMFLKTLEEPPAGTILLLTSQAPEGLLETIRSRLQLVRFGRLRVEDIRRAVAGRGREDEVAAMVELADGSLGRAMELCEGRLGPLRRRMLDSLAALGPGSYPEFGRTLADPHIEVPGDGDDSAEAEGPDEEGPAGAAGGGKGSKTEARRRAALVALGIAATLYRDAAAAAFGCGALINPDFREETAALAGRLGGDGARAAQERVAFAEHCVRRNCSVDLVCRVLCGQLVRIHEGRRR